MTQEQPPFVGPHEGREFDLMVAGQKHLSMFVLEAGEIYADYPDPRFDQFVVDGRFVKEEIIEQHPLAGGGELSMRCILYATANEAWRIPAIRMIRSVYKPLPGWRPDLERVIGALLGYDPVDVEQFVAKQAKP